MDNESDRSFILIIVAISSFMMPLMGMSINVALPAIGKELSIDAVMLGWVATSFIMASAMFVVPAGRIADIYGRKKIFLTGTVICTATSFVLTFSNSATALIVFRIFQGFGAAMVINTGIAIISSVYPAGERGKAIGIVSASVYSGQTLAPFIAGLLTFHIGWRSIFLVNVPFGVAVIAAVCWKMKDDWVESKGEAFDYVGSIVYGVMLVAIVYGLSKVPTAQGFWMVFVGILASLVFIKWELKTKTPIINLKLFRTNRTFTFSILSSMINYSSVFAITFLLSLYLQYIKGFSPQRAGFILAIQPVVQAIFSPLAGRLADKIQPRIIASAGMALTAIGLFIFTFLSADSTLPIILANLVLIGFSLAFFVSPNTNAIMGSVSKRYYGTASGTVATTRQIGMMLSMAITMLIFSFHMGNVEVTPEYYSDFLRSVKMVFIVYTVICSVGICTSLARGKNDMANL